MNHEIEWVQDLPSGEGTSFLNRQSAYFATFSWSIFDAFQISGFFTPKTANESSSIVAKFCLEANIDRHSTPKQIIDWLHELSKKLTRSPSGSSPVLNFTNSPIQIGIILRHNDYFYTATLGCQSHFYPSTEPSSFSLEIEVCGPHQILNRGENSFNFVFIASRGLVDYLQSQNIRHPVMIIQDELRNQFENCQTQEDISSVSTWTMECIERNYGRIPISIEVLLLCQRFWSNQPNLNNFNQLQPLCEQIDHLQIQNPRYVHEIPVPTVPVPPASSINSTNQTTEPEEDEEDRFLYDTAPPSTPISRVDPENDPRNLKNGDFPENCDQLKSVKAHVEGFDEFTAKFQERFPNCDTMSDFRAAIDRRWINETR